MTGWARAVTARPRTVLACSLALAAGGVAVTVAGLEFRADRSDLVDSDLPWQERYLDYKERFPRWDDAIVVVETPPDEPGLERVDAFIDTLERRLVATGEFGDVSAGFPSGASPAGMILTAPLEEVNEVVEELRRAAPALASPSPAALLRLSFLGGDLSDVARAELSDLLTRLARAGRGDPPPAGVLGASPPVQRFRSSTEQLSFVFVPLTADEAAGSNGVAGDAEQIAALRAEIDALLSRDEFTGVRAGVTGIPVIEADEASQSVTDASRATGLALVLIAALLAFVYRGVVIPALALGALLLGVAWSFGYLTLAVGHLQLLSVVFAVILLGLGVDTAIHLIARLELVHPDHDHMPAAVARTFVSVGPGVVTAALTTTAAFLATAFTDFAGVAEMGIIAAGGVVLCTISVMSCFPAMLELLPRPQRTLRRRRGGERKPFMGGALNALDHHPKSFLAGGALVAMAAAWFGSGLRYDPDLMKLLPTDVESARWERRLIEDDEQSVWHAVVLADTAERAEALTESLRDAPLVASVGGAGTLFPTNVAEKKRLLESIPAPQTPPATQPAPEAGRELRSVAASLEDRWRGEDESLVEAAASVAALSDPQAARAVEAYRADREALADAIAALREATLPAPGDLPGALREQLFTEDGAYVLRAFPKAPPSGAGSVLSPERLTPFASGVLAVAPTATGPAIQIYESTRLIEGAYLRAALYALIAILAILLVDFRNLVDAVSALAPVLIGAALLAATMRLVGMSLNFANMIVLPLIVGLGVSAGAHVLHRWRQQPHDPPAGLAGGSGRAIGLTILTTALGFICMTTARHRGIQSLGLVMAMGLGFVWVSAVLFLPPMLRVRTQARRREEPAAPAAAHARSPELAEEAA